MSIAAHVDGIVADFAAEYGRVDVVRQRVECEPDDRDAILDSFAAFGVVGGAGIRVRDDDGRVLLARYDGTDGWVDPGDGRQSGESYVECARRGVRETAGVDAAITGLARIHILYMDDWTDRDPVPNPFVNFEGRHRDGDPRAGRTAEEVRWFADPPDAEDLLYADAAGLTRSSS